MIKKRYLVLSFLACMASLTFLDRNCISVSKKLIGTELGISQTQWSWIFGAFALTYGISQIPMGTWAERFGQQVGVLATLPTTLGPICDLVRETARVVQQIPPDHLKVPVLSSPRLGVQCAGQIIAEIVQ